MKEEVCNCTRSGGIDEDIRPIVDALNAAGIETVASCCGHTFQPSSVTIRHNGVIKVLRLLTYTQARRIDRFFPGVNGERMYKNSSIANRKFVWSLIQDADALYDALADLVFLHGCEQEGIESGMPTPEQWTQAVDNAVIALKGARREKNETCFRRLLRVADVLV